MGISASRLHNSGSDSELGTSLTPTPTIPVSAPSAALAHPPSQQNRPALSALLLNLERSHSVSVLPKIKKQQLLREMTRALELRDADSVELNFSDIGLSRLPDVLLQCLTNLPAPLKTIHLSGNKFHHLPYWLFNLVSLSNTRMQIVLANVPLSERTLQDIHRRTLKPDYAGPLFLNLPTHGADVEPTEEYITDELLLWERAANGDNLQPGKWNRSPLCQGLIHEFGKKAEQTIKALRINNAGLSDEIPTELANFIDLKDLIIDIGYRHDFFSPNESNHFNNSLLHVLNRLPNLERFRGTNLSIQNALAEFFSFNLKSLNLIRSNITQLPEIIDTTEIFEKPEGRQTAMATPFITPLALHTDQVNNLEALDLTSNQIEKLPVSFGNFKNLLTLYLSHNKFQKFPVEILNLPALQTLDLGFNRLIAVPPEITQLTQLKSLLLHFSRLETLPSTIGTLTKLEHLHLENNRLTTLPLGIGELENLKILNLAGNLLTDLPLTVGNLHSLERLTLSENPELRTLPLTLFDLPASCTIILENTGLSQPIIREWRDRMQNDPASPRLFFGLQAPDRQLVTFKSLREAFVFWLGSSIDLVLDDQMIAAWEKHPQAESFIQWLGRLRETQDFKNLSTRPALTRLIENLLVHLKEVNTPALITEIFTRAEESLNHCSDRIITGAKQVSLILLRNVVNDATASTGKILDCGITEYLSITLEMIAGRRIMQLRAVDPVETYLAYEKHFGALFKHLYMANSMDHEALSHVQAIDLWRGLESLLSELRHPEGLEAYLMQADSIWALHCELVEGSPVKQALDALRSDYLVQEEQIELEKIKAGDPVAWAQLDQQWQEIQKAFQVQEKTLRRQALSKAIETYVPLSVRNIVETQRFQAQALDNLLKKDESKADTLLKDYQTKSDQVKAYRRAHQNSNFTRSPEFRQLERSRKEALDAWQVRQDKMKPVRDLYAEVWKPVGAALQTLRVPAT